jgi:hypothetical protein
MKLRNVTICAAVALAFVQLPFAHAQRGGGGGGRGGAGGRGNQTAQAAAPVDLTGYWVALVTEDWRWRMMTPEKGDFPSIPLNPAGRDLAMAWDPAKDEANGDQCKSYGAGNVMRLPARFHITWADPNTLKVEVDNGTQTRLIHFANGQNAAAAAPNPADAKNWQGNSVASWEAAGGRGAARAGELKVVTTLTEDPAYLQQPHIRSSHYKKLPDATGWNPTPCTAR